jgi:general secretion pathway protein C
VERSALDEILEQQFELMRATRVRPVREDGQVTGLRISRARAGTLLHAIGIRSGDVVHSINDFPLTDPQRALQAYGRLRTVDHLAVSLTRKGQPVTIDIDIR